MLRRTERDLTIPDVREDNLQTYSVPLQNIQFTPQRGSREAECPLSGVKRTLWAALGMSAFSHKRTFGSTHPHSI